MYAIWLHATGPRSEHYTHYRVEYPLSAQTHVGHQVFGKPQTAIQCSYPLRCPSAQHFPGKRHCAVPSGIDYLRLTPVENLP